MNPSHQPNGNILCSVNYKSKETAISVCRVFKSTSGCDGLLTYDDPKLGGMYLVIILIKNYTNHYLIKISQ